MKLASILLDGRGRYGLIYQDGLYMVRSEIESKYPTLKDLIANLSGGDLSAGDLIDDCDPKVIPFEDFVFLPPIPVPEKIICVGMNYHKPYPIKEVKAPEPTNPVIFSRDCKTLVGHRVVLEIPPGEAAETYDFEGEIVAVIGKGGRFISKKNALDHVAGYSIMNEGYVRGWMKHSVHAGKNFYASGSWGPWITTADEIGNPEQLTIETRLNGNLMQSASASEMIFGVEEMIAYISNLLPLCPGDVIATGSPDGAGGSCKPPIFLKNHDCVEITVSEIGTLKNYVGTE